MPARSPAPTRIVAAQLADLGQRIRERRKALGVSTVAAAAAAGISRVTLHRIEHGEPSVTMGAYLSAIAVLDLALVPGMASESRSPVGAPEGASPGRTSADRTNLGELPPPIRVADYPQLQRIAWHIGDSVLLTEQEALGLYERNWRHVDLEQMPTRERELLDRLVKTQGKGRLLV